VKHLMLLLVFAGGLGMIAVGAACESSLPSHVVAEVDGQLITNDEFAAELSRILGDPSGISGEGEESKLDDLKQTLLDQLIEKKLLVNEAHRMKLEVTDEEVDALVNRIKEGYPEGGFEEAIVRGEVSLTEWKEFLRRRALIQKVIDCIVDDATPTDEDILIDYYERHRSEFAVPERVRARHIVVHDLKTAEEIATRLKKGQPFEELAAKFSVGPEAALGGDLGYFSGGDMPPEFDVVFQLKVGAVSPVVTSAYGYHLFQVTDHRGGSVSAFEEGSDEVRERVRQEREETVLSQWFTDRRAKGQVRINKKALAAVGPDRSTSGGAAP